MARHFQYRVRAGAGCWNCRYPSPDSPCCHKCHKLQDINESCDLFQVFGIPRSLRVDLTHLQELYYDLCKKTHPDKFTDASQARELVYAQRWSATINRGYRMLKDLRQRAHYLLKLEGYDPNLVKTVPSALAQTYFEIQDALTDDDGRAKLQSFQKQLEDEKQAIATRFTELGNNWDKRVAENKTELLRELTDYLVKGRYIDSMLADIKKKAGS